MIEAQAAPTEQADSPHVSLDPAAQAFEIRSEPNGLSVSNLGFPFHEVEAVPAFEVEIANPSASRRRLRISITCAHPHFLPAWIRWTKPVSPVTSTAGSAGDGEEEAALLTTIPARATRRARLRFAPTVEGYAVPGDYPFEVVLTDAVSGEVLDVRPGTLRLRNPVGQLLPMLPAIYGEAVEKERREISGPVGPFFERYLLGFEDGIVAIRTALNHLHRLFGPFSAPSDTLVWLATWVAMPLHESWPEMKRRQLINEAVFLFRWRGTKKGLSRYLEIYTGYRPTIDDRPVEGMRLGESAELFSTGAILGDLGAHTFTVTLAVPDPRLIDEKIVREIIESEKPAHTAYALRIVRLRSLPSRKKT